MGVANDYPKPRAIGVNEGQTQPFHQCPIKAQAAASVGLTGLSLDFAKKRELCTSWTIRSQRKGKRGVCERHLLCMCSVVLIYIDLR